MKDLEFCCYYEFCGKDFNNKYNLKRHINTVHLQIKKYQCEICDKFLVSKIACKEHLNSHLKIKPLRCPYLGCNLVFSRSSLLCTHKKLHDPAQSYIKKEKIYEKRNTMKDLPCIKIERKKNQAHSKIPLHHSLIF